MSIKYTLRVKNDSGQSGSIFVYKNCPDQEDRENIVLLEWFSKECNPETEVLFELDIDDSMSSRQNYWIWFADFEEGKIVDVNNISQAVEVVFAPNVYEQSFIFTENNEWKVTD